LKRKSKTERNNEKELLKVSFYPKIKTLKKNGAGHTGTDVFLFERYKGQNGGLERLRKGGKKEEGVGQWKEGWDSMMCTSQCRGVVMSKTGGLAKVAKKQGGTGGKKNAEKGPLVKSAVHSTQRMGAGIWDKSSDAPCAFEKKERVS